MARAPLADPDWPAMLPHCPGCGYNLNGLLPPVACPECGFHVDDKTLVLQGVVKADASASPIRRVLWGITITIGGIILYGWMGLVLIGWFGLAIFLTWLTCFIVLIATSKRDRAGRVAIVFAKGGFIAVADLSDPRNEGSAVTWDRVDGIQLDRISPVWYKLQMWASGEKLLDAGVRCRDEQAALVYDTLEARRTNSIEMQSNVQTPIAPQAGPERSAGPDQYDL